MKKLLTFSFLAVLSSTILSHGVNAVEVRIKGTYNELDLINGEHPSKYKLEIVDTQKHEMIHPTEPNTFEAPITTFPTPDKPVEVRYTYNQTLPHNARVRFQILFTAGRFSMYAFCPETHITQELKAINLVVNAKYQCQVQARNMTEE